MNVFLTFDVEVWCDGWDNLDKEFPGAFERYIFGHSQHGDYALPKTLAVLNKYGLKGVFFVEPLFAIRFGTRYLETIVQLIRAAGQEIQLHLHPEWTDESIEPIIENCSKKRQHLTHYTLDEQTALIGHSKRMLEAAGSGPISAFRSGSYAANCDTFEALRRNGIYLDSSLNRCYDISAPDLRSEHLFDRVFAVQDVVTYPVTVFKDGFGKLRPAQVGACGFNELRDTLQSAARVGVTDFVIVSHNFELLIPDSLLPDWIVVARFERLCAYLAQHSQQFEVGGFNSDLTQPPNDELAGPVIYATRCSTLTRYWEQFLRRLLGKLPYLQMFTRKSQPARVLDIPHE